MKLRFKDRRNGRGGEEGDKNREKTKLSVGIKVQKEREMRL